MQDRRSASRSSRRQTTVPETIQERWWGDGLGAGETAAAVGFFTYIASSDPTPPPCPQLAGLDNDVLDVLARGRERRRDLGSGRGGCSGLDVIGRRGLGGLMNPRNKMLFYLESHQTILLQLYIYNYTTHFTIMHLPFYPLLKYKTTKKGITTPLIRALILSISEAMGGDGTLMAHRP